MAAPEPAGFWTSSWSAADTLTFKDKLYGAEGKECSNTGRQAVDSLLFCRVFYKGCPQRLEEEGWAAVLFCFSRKGWTSDVCEAECEGERDQEEDEQKTQIKLATGIGGLAELLPKMTLPFSPQFIAYWILDLLLFYRQHVCSSTY